MSQELKARLLGQTMNEYGCDTKIYIKDEVDAVLAEKDAEIARLKAICKVHIEAIESMEAGLLQNDEEIRHHKYKRCLAMARWCASRSASWCLDPADEQLHKSDFYDKWKKRWLELAEKFKEAK